MESMKRSNELLGSRVKQASEKKFLVFMYVLQIYRLVRFWKLGLVFEKGSDIKLSPNVEHVIVAIHEIHEWGNESSQTTREDDNRRQHQHAFDNIVLRDKFTIKRVFSLNLGFWYVSLLPVGFDLDIFSVVNTRQRKKCRRSFILSCFTFPTAQQSRSQNTTIPVSSHSYIQYHDRLHPHPKECSR